MTTQKMSPKAKTSRAGTSRKRHAEVVEAAAHVFNAKGYEATTIQDIADELGILKGSVYYYISSKEDILYEVLEDVHRLGLETATKAVEIEGDPIEKISSFVSSLSRFNAENRMRIGILLRELRSLSARRRREIVRERDRYDDILRELMIEGQKQGLVAPSIDPKITTLAVMGMINNIYQWYKPSGGMKAEKIGELYAELVVRAISA